MATLSWQPELHLLRTVSASATALEGVLVASTISGDTQVLSGPSITIPGQAKASLRVVKGSCSVLHSACTVACRSISEKVKLLQRPGTQEDTLKAVASSAQNSGEGSKTQNLGSNVGLSKQHPPGGADGNERTQGKGKMRGDQSGRPSDPPGKTLVAKNVTVKSVARPVVQISDKGTQTDMVSIVDTGMQTEVDVRKSDRLKEKMERGFLNDKISDLDNAERFSRKEVMHDAWKDYDMNGKITLSQYMKIACLICEGYLRKGPGGGAWYSANRKWKDWEPYVKEAENEKYGT